MISFCYCYMPPPHTHTWFLCVALPFLELTLKTRLVKDPPVSASQVLGLKAAPPLPGYLPSFCVDSGDLNTGPHACDKVFLPLSHLLSPQTTNFY